MDLKVVKTHQSAGPVRYYRENTRKTKNIVRLIVLLVYSFFVEEGIGLERKNEREKE